MHKLFENMQVIDFDDLINSFEAEVEKTVKHENPKASKSEVKKEINKKTSSVNSLLSSREFINSLASSSLNRLIKGSANYQVLKKEITLLEADAKYYDDDSDYVKKLLFLKATYKEYNEVIKFGTNYDYRKAKLQEIHASKEIKEFRDKISKLKSLRKNTSSYSLILLIHEYRKRLKLSSSSINLDSVANLQLEDDMQELMFDRNESNKTIHEKYLEILKYLQGITGIPATKLFDMKVNQIRIALRDNLKLEERRKQLDVDIESEKFKMKVAQSELSGDIVAKIAVENYDLNDKEGAAKAIELLVSSRVSHVLASANTIANRFDIKNNSDVQDIVGEGLKALSEYAIKWKNDQIKSPNIIINFDVYLHKNLNLHMMKMAASLKNMGTKHPTTAIFDMGKNKGMIEKFIKDNPNLNLKDTSYEQILSIYTAMEDKSKGTRLRDNVTIKRAADFGNDNDDGGGEDMFNNTFVDIDTQFEMVDNIHDFITILKHLFKLNTKKFSKNLQEIELDDIIKTQYGVVGKVTKVDTQGSIEILWEDGNQTKISKSEKRNLKIVKKGLKKTNKKYFDKYDLILMKMMLGVIPGPDKVISGKDKFGKPVYREGVWIKEASMAAYFKEKFGKNPNAGKFPSSQEAINFRKKNIIIELGNIKKHYPKCREMVDVLIRMFQNTELTISMTTKYSDRIEDAMDDIYNELDKK